MKAESYRDIKERLEDLKEGIPKLEGSIKSRKIKYIEHSCNVLSYYLHKIHKFATDKQTANVLKDTEKFIWWKKLNSKKDKKKFVNVKKQYEIWAKSYDTDSNLLIFLEDKFADKFFGKVKGKDVLDFGCGTGRYAIPLAKKGANVTAIDFSNPMLKIAKQKSRKAKVKINFSRQNIVEYKPKKKYDLIISMLVQDHVKKLKKSVEVINKASGVGTRVIVSNVHPSWIHKNFVTTGKSLGYVVKGYTTPQYYHPLEEYVELFKEKGFLLTKIKETIFEKKYQNKNEFKKLLAMFKDRTVGIIMEFEKIK